MQPKERKEPIYLPPGVFWGKFMYFHLSLSSDLLRAPYTIHICLPGYVWVMNTCPPNLWQPLHLRPGQTFRCSHWKEPLLFHMSCRHSPFSSRNSDMDHHLGASWLLSPTPQNLTKSDLGLKQKRKCQIKTDSPHPAIHWFWFYTQFQQAGCQISNSLCVFAVFPPLPF